MRIYLLLILAICLFAFQQSHAGVVIGNYYSAGGDASCDNLGSYELYYDVDHTSGTTTACVTGSTVTVTIDDASSEQNNTSGGTYSFKYDGVNESIEITNSSYISSSEGYVKFSLYCSTGTNVDSWYGFEFYYDGSNYIALRRQTTPRFVLYHVSTSGGSNTLIETTALTESAWNTVEFAWSVSNTYLGARVNGGSWTENTSAGITAFSSEAASIFLGEETLNDGPAAALYFDDIYLSSDYTP